MTIITATTGSESFKAGSATFRVHAANSRLFPMVVADWAKAFLGKANQGVVQQGRLTKLYASTSPLDALGTFWGGTYEVADGMILVVEATKSIAMATRGNSMARKAFVGLRVRADGPLIKVGLQRVADPLAAHFDVQIQGRMDVLTYNEMLRLGADPSRGKMQELPLYAPTRRASLLDVVTISPQLAAPSVRQIERLDLGEGQVVSVPTARRPRMVDLGE